MPIAKHKNVQLPAKTNKEIVHQEKSHWDAASGRQQELAIARLKLIEPIIEQLSNGVTLNTAANWLASEIKSGSVKFAGKRPSASTIKRYVTAYKKHGREGLLPNNKGRTRKDYGWEAEAIELYNISSKPDFSGVAWRLRQLGYDSATDSRVRRYLKSLPTRLNSSSPARIGKHEYRLNHTLSKSRDKSVLLVGEIYQGDGHTVDAYVAHPNTGKPYRPELTAWIDVRSRYLAGWYLSEAESANSTLFALSHAFVSNDHIPAWLYIDNGSGFKAKLMNDSSTGFYAKFDVSTTFSIPGNPRAKGDIEGWFRIFRDKHDKFWNQGRDYCGHDQAGEVNRRLSVDINQGKRQLLSLSEYSTSIAQFIYEYNRTPSAALNGKSPAELWQALEKVPVEIKRDAVIRPREIRMARNSVIKLHNRMYKASILYDYDGLEMAVEYDLHDDRKVWIYDADSRFICEANLMMKIPYMPQSRLDEAREKRLAGQKQRLQRRLKEAEARSFNPLETKITPEAAEEQKKIAAEIKNTAIKVPSETPKERYQRYLLLKDKPDLSQTDADFVELYPQSVEFLTQSQLEEDL